MKVIDIVRWSSGARRNDVRIGIIVYGVTFNILTIGNFQLDIREFSLPSLDAQSEVLTFIYR